MSGFYTIDPIRLFLLNVRFDEIRILSDLSFTDAHISQFIEHGPDGRIGVIEQDRLVRLSGRRVRSYRRGSRR